MTIEVINQPPAPDAFTSLAEHQSQTPGTFFGGKPVLHYQCASCSLVLFNEPEATASTFPLLRGGTSLANGDDIESPATKVIRDVEVWVGSEHLILFSASSATGLSVPYPSISLHAVQRLMPPGKDLEVPGLYMQFALTDSDLVNSDDDFETLEMTIIPPETLRTEETPSATNGDAPAAPNSTQELFSAVSACADLHPDPATPEEGEATMSNAPGAGGWITAENMHEFVDEDGNFIGEDVSATAGTVRERDDEEDDRDGGETKWQRTE